MTDAPKIRLFAFSTGWGIPFPTSGPFPLKLAAWLRSQGLPFEFVVANNPAEGPKGKSPWIEMEGTRMGDTTLIMAHLRARFGIDEDAHLTPAQRARGVAVQRMLEDHYHQCFEHQLFFGEGGPARAQEFFSTLGFPLRLIAPPLILRAFSKQLYARGMGRHSPEVILEQGCADLDALAELLGDQEFLLGDRPSSFDATVFGFLGVTVYVEGNNPLFRHAADNPRLMAYCERLRQLWFPETLAQLPLRSDIHRPGIEPTAQVA